MTLQRSTHRARRLAAELADDKTRQRAIREIARAVKGVPKLRDGVLAALGVTYSQFCRWRLNWPELAEAIGPRKVGRPEGRKETYPARRTK